MPRVVKVSVGQVEAFIAAITSRVELVTEKPHQYEKLRARADSKLIIVYATGKVVYDDDASLHKAVLEVFREQNVSEAFDVVVGADEAGKGEWLGPMVVAAVAADRDSLPLLRSEGVMDSKLLSTRRIRELAEAVSQISLALQTTLVKPSRFNDLLAELKTEGKGLNKMLAWAHKTALDSILTEDLFAHGRVRVVVDEFDKFWSRAEFEKLTERKRIELELYPRAEENLAVAAASITARAAREEWIDRKSQELGVDLRKMTGDQIAGKPWANEVAKLSYIKKE